MGRSAGGAPRAEGLASRRSRTLALRYKHRVRLSLSVPPGLQRRAALELARALAVPVPIALGLSRRAEVLLALDETRSRALLGTLQALGAKAALAAGGGTACPAHPQLGTLERCSTCGAPVCAACELKHGARRCAACEGKRVRRARFRNLRVAVLLAVLAAVAVWGYQRSRRRALRHSWARPLEVAVVLVSTRAPPEAAVGAWRRGVGRLEDWMQGEYERFNPPPGLTMVRFELAGPVKVDAPLPLPKPDAPVAERTRATLEFEAAAAQLDRQAGLDQPDLVVDVWLEPGSGPAFVEGIGEAGGTRGLVHGNLDDTEIDLELMAVAHEALHCLGATDKYGPDAHPTAEGLADPAQVPLYPQRDAEVMAGERATAEGDGQLPEGLSQVRVGPLTAREVGWRSP